MKPNHDKTEAYVSGRFGLIRSLQSHLTTTKYNETLFHKELEEIRGKIIHIGEKANDAGRLAVSSFIESDLEKAQLLP